MQEEFRSRDVLILIDVVYTIGIKSTGTADQAMDFVAFVQKQFGQVAAVLASDSGYKGSFHLGYTLYVIRY
jgi:hypothetical protein